jgi:nitronate monooxygenase
VYLRTSGDNVCVCKCVRVCIARCSHTARDGAWQIREFFKGTVVLAGAISDGRAIRTAEVLGADLAYLGTRFIATRESMASDAYKHMLVHARDGPAPTFLPTVYTDKISGAHR